MKKTINELIDDDNFMNSMLECQDPRQVQSLFSAQGFDIPIEEIILIGKTLNITVMQDGELTDDELDTVAGGVESFTRASSTLSLTRIQDYYHKIQSQGIKMSFSRW